MGSLTKNLVKSLSNLRTRLVTSSTLNNLFAPNSSLKIADEEIKHRLLLKRFRGSPIDGLQYFSPLSGENLSPTKNICFPLFEGFKDVAGSCGGLVCLDNAKGEVVLWNPSTREVKIIPASGNMRNTLLDMNHCFASGFGYDYESHDLKVLRFITNFASLDGDELYAMVHSLLELYSLKTDSWKKIDHPGFFVLRNPSIYIDGCYYWLAYGTDLSFILSFDFATEDFSQYALPEVGRDLGGFLHFDLVDFHGSVGVIVFPKLGTDKAFELWLCSDGKSWTKEIVIRVPGAERPLGFWNNCNLLFFEGINSQLMVYDMTTGGSTNLDIFDYPEKMQILPYVESAVSIKELQGSRDAFRALIQRA